MDKLNPWLELAGRILLVTLFIVSGLGKIPGYEATAGYMQAKGVPGLLLPVVIAVELLGGLAVAIGFRTRLAAFLLAGFTLLTLLFFHNPLVDPGEQVQFLKNLGITGALLLVIAQGAGPLSLDARRA
jgi:putative oxidoreductase